MSSEQRLRVFAPPDAIVVWVVYDHPKDCAWGFVLRPQVVKHGSGEITFGIGYARKTLEEVRALVPDGLVRLERHPDDDPVILETWM